MLLNTIGRLRNTKARDRYIYKKKTEKKTVTKYLYLSSSHLWLFGCQRYKSKNHQTQFDTVYQSATLSFNKPILFYQCSTTCGIGAIWRTVVCSSQHDDDCASMKRPEPARTCLLRPCTTWQSGTWSKASCNHASLFTLMQLDSNL